MTPSMTANGSSQVEGVALLHLTGTRHREESRRQIAISQASGRQRHENTTVALLTVSTVDASGATPVLGRLRTADPQPVA